MVTDSHVTMRGTDQDEGGVSRWSSEVQGTTLETGPMAETPTMVVAIDKSDGTSLPLEAPIQQDKGRTDEMSTGKCDLLQTPGEAHMSTFAQIQPRAGELCRLLATILGRALEGDDQGCLTRGGKST